VTTATHGARRNGVRSLPIAQWPIADQSAWAAACQPTYRLKRGGAASHLKPVTQHDLAQRYGYFLDHVSRSGGLDQRVPAGGYVTPERIGHFVEELRSRVSSVTLYGTIHKVRRTVQLLVPGRDFTWLIEIEKDLALVMQPRSKFNRFVGSELLVEAGMTLMAEGEQATHRSALARARQFRDGLMVALLATCPIRLKNFAALEIGRSFKQVDEAWWIVLSAAETKEARADERAVPAFLTQCINRYISIHRPALVRPGIVPAALWLSSNDGHALSYSATESVISKTTLATVGVDVSPHLFRTAAASTAAMHAGQTPHLASALLHHTHPSVTEKHYNRASSMSAAQTYGALMQTFRRHD
jgi:integrase